MASPEKKLNSLKFDLIKLAQAGKFKKAEKIYPKYKNRNIQDAELWRIFAGIHSQRKNWDDFIHCCKNIIKIDPNDDTTFYNLSAALQNLNNIDEAIQQYENCIAINPKHANAYINCAHLHYLTGNIEKSKNYYHHALEQVDTPELRLKYGEILMESNEINNALKQLHYVLEKKPDNKTNFLVAQCYYEIKNYDESEKYYLKLLSNESNNVSAINNLGRLYEETGKLNQSLEQYAKAIKINGNIANIHLNYGKVLVKTADLISAEGEFNKSIEIEPEHPEAYLSLGKVYAEQHDYDKAIKCFKQALSKDVAKYMEKPDGFLKTVKYYLSTVEEPDHFNKEKQLFIAKQFDEYSDTFDKHLVDALNYRVPEVINEVLDQHLSKDDYVTIDLGCGTGLCCKYLIHRSSKVIGVDIAQKMIEQSRKINCYDELIVGEISEIVNNHKDSFDLVVAADVFIYVGSLLSIFKACHKKMNKDGYFIFSTEHWQGNHTPGYKQIDSGRYEHANNYIEELSKEYGFSVIEQRTCVIRKEYNTNVDGYITLLKKL